MDAEYAIGRDPLVAGQALLAMLEAADAKGATISAKVTAESTDHRSHPRYVVVVTKRVDA